jgi:hypothetical protein
MDQRTLATSIAELTGTLRPAPGSTEADLERGRLLLAQALRSGQAATEFRGAATLGSNPNAADQADRFLHLFAGAPAAARRAFSRTVPSPTSLHASTPEWARGIAVAESAGPFLTPLGNPIWIDVLDIVQLTTVTRDVAGTVVGLFPVDSAQSTSQQLVLGAGSVWLPAQSLAAASPDGSYAGFRIKGGTLSFDQKVGPVSLGTLAIPATTVATLTVDLDPPAAPPAGPGPGAGGDAATAVVALPASAAIEFHPAGAQVTAVADASLEAYGQTVNLHWAGAAPAFAAATSQLLLPLDFLPGQFHAGAAASKVLQPSGTAPILQASWALPVAVTTPAGLGEAAGAGALQLTLGAGLAEQWAGLPEAAALKGAELYFAPGQIVILAAGSGAQQVSQAFRLWQSSSIDFVRARRFGTFFYCQAGLEWFEVNGAAVAHLDRPLRADGSRFALKIPNGVLLIAETAAARSFIAIGLALETKPAETVAIALENALLVVDRPVAMAVFGELDPANPSAVEAGLVGLELGIRGILPTLPDPYASSVAVRDFSTQEAPVGALFAAVAWKSPDAPDLAFALFIPGASAIELSRRGFVSLLDLSTHADLFGVEFRELASTVDQMALALPGSSVAVFTVPQISWEPMKSDPPVANLHADDDGGSSRFRVESVNLTRVEPAAALRFLVSEVEAGAVFDARFTLPFGLVARVSGGQLPDTVGTFRLTRPRFEGYSGGLQLTLGARDPEAEDASLPGTCEAIDPYGIAVLGLDVATIFNQEFRDGTLNEEPQPPARVPVRRIDFSGYGASTFSDWRDSVTEVGIVKAQFDVLVGRTALDVVKAQSYLYPWAARVVRTITIERQAAGWVHRTDSGWQAASEGLFVFPKKEQADYSGHVHPGAVLGVVNIRNLREVKGGLISVSGLDYQQVLFDADVLINNSFPLAKGGHVEAGCQLVPSKDVGGYVQLTPGDGASRLKLGDLLKKTGPVGGPVACIGNVGGPGGPQLTAVSMDASVDKTGSDANLVAALRGSLGLPGDGAWTIARQIGGGEPAPLDPKFHLPLVQNDVLDPGKWHFADPADIARIATPTIAYGMVQATGTQKLFFARPFVDQAAPASFNLPQPPHLADVGALLNATGLFPDLGSALPFGSIPPLGVAGTDITFHPAPFSLTGQKPKTLVDFKAVKVLLDYSDGKGNPTRVDVSIDPGGTPSWRVSLDPISLILVTPFGDENDPILRVVGGAIATAIAAPTLTSLDVRYGGALAPVQTVFSKLDEIASFLPGAPFSKLQVSFSQGRLTIKDTFALPELPLGFGYVTDVSLNLGAAIQLSPQALDFTAGIGSEQKPFHWLVSPLSGTGVVQVGVHNGDLAVLIEAGLGVGLAIDLAIASGSASVVIAIQVNNEVAPFQIKAILTGQASVDVLDGLASAAITLSATLGITPDKLPIPDALTLYAGVAVGIHLSVCWLVSVDFDGAWGFSETFHKPGIVPF